MDDQEAYLHQLIRTATMGPGGTLGPDEEYNEYLNFEGQGHRAPEACQDEDARQDDEACEVDEVTNL